MTSKDLQNYFSSLTAHREKKKKNKTNKSRTTQISVLILFGICGCLSVSTATLLMQTECCLRLVHFLFFLFFWCIILSLRIGCSTVLQRVLFSQWPYSVLFYSMHKTVFVYLSMSLLCCGHDLTNVHLCLSSPSFSSYCDDNDDDDDVDEDDDEPISTYISLFLCFFFFFATRH